MNFFVSKYKITVTFLIIGGFFLLSTDSVYAQKYTREISRVYEAFDDYVQVSENREVRIDNSSIYIAAGNSDTTTIFADIRPDTEEVDNSRDTISTLSVKRTNGADYSNYSLDTTGSNPVLNIKFDRDVEAGIPFTVNVGYRSKGIIYKSGKVRDIFIPGFSEDFKFSDSEKREIINTIVKVPKSLGNISFAIPNGVISESSDHYDVTFKQEDLVGRSAWIEIGTEQVYEFNITQEFPKSNDIIFGTNTYRVVLPRNIKSGNITQEVFFTEVYPTPVAVYEDENGNLIGEFTVPSKESGKISIKGYAKLTKESIDYSKYTGTVDDISDDILTSNTLPGDYWESDNSAVKNAALEAIEGLNPKTSSVFSIAERLYKYVIGKIDYSDVKRFGINERQGALKTLQGGAAVCMEYSDLYIALLRSVGIPARAVLGYGYTGIDSTDSSEHQWVEVYIPDLGWVSVDTTWGESAPELLGGDLNHFYIHVASENPNTPAPIEVSFIGEIGDLSDRGLTVIPTSEEVKGTSASELISQYPKSESDSKSRTIAFDSGLRGLKDFYEENKQILNPILIVLAFIFAIPIAIKINRLVSRTLRRNKSELQKESKILKSFESRPVIKPLESVDNTSVQDAI